MEQILENKELNSFFIGTLLGDSYIHNGVFYCKQISKDLIDFKYQFIKDNLKDSRLKITEYNEYIDKYNVHHQKYWVLSLNHSIVNKLHQIFYNNDKKIYPNHSILQLTPLGFSMWYADDGTTILVQINKNSGQARSRRVQICTDNFTLNEHSLIIEDLKSLNYYPKCIDRFRNNQYRIQLNNNFQEFICMLEDNFLKFPSLLYKLDLGYRNKSLQSRNVLDKYRKCFERISAHPQFKDRIKEKLIEDYIVQTSNINVSE